MGERRTSWSGSVPVACAIALAALREQLAHTGRSNLLTVAHHRGVVADTEQMLDELVALLGLGGFVDSLCGAMSGGEQQRLAIACALAGAPPLVLADEPTDALDAKSAATLIEALRTVVAQGATVVVATHDEAVVRAADRTLELVDDLSMDTDQV